MCKTACDAGWYMDNILSYAKCIRALLSLELNNLIELLPEITF